MFLTFGQLVCVLTLFVYCITILHTHYIYIYISCVWRIVIHIWRGNTQPHMRPCIHLHMDAQTHTHPHTHTPTPTPTPTQTNKQTNKHTFEYTLSLITYGNTNKHRLYNHRRLQAKATERGRTSYSLGLNNYKSNAVISEHHS